MVNCLLWTKLEVVDFQPSQGTGAMNVLVRVNFSIPIFTGIFTVASPTTTTTTKRLNNRKGHLEIHELDAESQCREVFSVQLT